MTGTSGAAGSIMAGAGQGGQTGSGETRQRLAVTADFLNQTLSIVDIAKLTDGAKREDALVGTVDLSKYSPGPLALGITPDGKTALVSISGGWLGAFTTVPAGNGTLVFVDLEKRTVLGELYTGASPMGIVITQDGKHAFVGQYSETYFAYVDIEKRTYQPIQTGNSFNEELAIDDTGTVGILTYGPMGDSTTFSVADPTSGLGATFGLSGDAGGAAFFPGTKSAFVVQAPTALTGNVGGHNVVNVTDPKAPVASDNIRMANSPQWYAVTAVPRRSSVAFPVAAADGTLSVTEMKLEGDTAKEVQTVAVGKAMFAYGVTADPDGRVLLAVPEEHFVAVVDLDAAKAFMVPWGVTQTGPNDIKVIP